MRGSIPTGPATRSRCSLRAATSCCGSTWNSGPSLLRDGGSRPILRPAKLNGSNAPSWLYLSLFDPTLTSPPPGRKVRVPTGFMLCPNDLGVPPPDSWLRRSYNMVHRNDAKQGGHFLAFEQPRLFVQELRGFFRQFR